MTPPARASREIAQEPHQRAARARSLAPPFRERRLHHLGAGRPGIVEEPFGVLPPRGRDVEAVERFRVMVADILESPASGDVVGAALDEGRVHGRRLVRLQHDGSDVRHVGEAEAFRAETHLRPPRLLDGPAVGADPVVMADALVGDERQLAAPGRVRRVRHVGPQRRRHLGQHSVEQGAAPQRRRHAQHRRLLRHLARAAQHGEAGRGLRARQELAGFRLDAGAESRVRSRVVEIREGEVLPHHQAEFVAQRVEGIRLVTHRPADADGVHAGFARLGQQRQERLAGARQGPRCRGWSSRRPGRTPGCR